MKKAIACILSLSMLIPLWGCSLNPMSAVNKKLDSISTAVEIGDHKISSTELTYFYVDGINNWYSQYGSYASYIGLDTSLSLDQQFYDENAGTTWADYFLDEAIESAKNVYALCDAAKTAGYSLGDEDQENIDTLYKNLENTADEAHLSVGEYLKSVYGDFASEKTYKSYYETIVLASAYYNHYATELKDSYTEPDLRAFEKDEPYKYNSYTYASFYLSVDTFKVGGTKGDDGTVTYSDDEIQAAKKYLEKVKDQLTAENIDTVQKLNKAIAKMEDEFDAYKAEAEKKDDTSTETDKNETTDTEKNETSDSEKNETSDSEKNETSDTEKNETSDTEKNETSDTEKNETSDSKEEDDDISSHSTATENKKTLYSSVNSVMQEWIRDTARKNGDITAIAYETTSTGDDGKESKELKGYYIVLFQQCHDNMYPLANVRHILVAFEGGTYNISTGKTTYSDAEKSAAKTEAERLLKEWQDGAATENSFAALANKNSDDGDGTTGGLYEDVYPGQMVANFNDWCFADERKAGDTGVIETEYGYHVMYYVGDSDEIYRDYMITNDKLTAEMEEWQNGLLEAITVVEKNLKRIDKGLVLGSKHLHLRDGHDH